jgi:predicted ATPase
VLTDANASAVARICTRLDGLPLAIELAAARVKLLPPAVLARQLGDLHASSLDFLTGGAADAPARQRTQRETIRWSYDLLDPAEQRGFRALAVFHGSFSLAAVKAVTGAAGIAGRVLETLGSLVDKSLVIVHETPGDDARFGMLETIREFAGERLREAGEAPELERRHFAFALATVRAAEPELKGPRQVATLDLLEWDLPNYRAALGGALGRGEAEPALELCVALRWFWLMRGYSTEGRRWFRNILATGALSARARGGDPHHRAPGAESG